MKIVRSIEWKLPTTTKRYIVVLAGTTVVSIILHVFREDMIGIIHDIVAFVISFHGFLKVIK